MFIRSASGLRGIAKEDFSLAVIDQYISSYVQNQNIHKCALGRDGRKSGAEISEWVIDSLVKNGVDVVNCELATTPTMQLITEKSQFDGGIVITASHNPSEYNGLKFLQADGTFLTAKQCEELFKSVDNKIQKESAAPVGKISNYKDADKDHINTILKLSCIEPEKIKNNKFKVIIDATNGGASKILPALCKALNCAVTMISCDGNGDYSRNPEPLSINLSELEKRVIKENADIGLATDPDGDRLSIVSNTGAAIGEELSLPLAIMNYSFYSSQSETFVTNLSTSMMVDDIVSSFNGILIRSKIGEANVVSLMKKHNVNLGGEGNGGIILKEAHLGRDSLVGTVMVLNLMSIKGKPLSSIIAEIPKYVFIKDKIKLNSSKEIDIDGLESVFNCDEINKLDGIKFIWKDKWIHIRKSNTEPILRIFAEGASENELKSLTKKLKEFVK
jgi:phosphomannomutase|tara:strand:+ start:11075 stop:12412 length:1338 start_codon:yes stop_codon:yes gene_type:complete